MKLTGSLMVVLMLVLGISFVGNALADAGPDAVAVSMDAAPSEAPADAAEADPAEMFAGLVKAAKAGDWRLVAAFLLSLLVWAATKSGVRDKIRWFKGDRGGAVLVGSLALAGAVSTALMSDAPMDAKLFVNAVVVMLTAVGGFTWLKRLLFPKDKKA